MAKNASKSLITPPLVLSYPNLVTPQAADSDDGEKRKPKYSAALIALPGTDVSEIEAAVWEVAKEFFGEKIKTPGGLVSLRDAFTPEYDLLYWPLRTDAVKKGYPKGSVFFNARTERKPTVVSRRAGPDGKVVVLSDQEVLELCYPGALVKASITLFGFDKKGNKGVAVSLNNVQFWDHGERIDGRVAAEDEFTADLNEEPASLADVM